jgi:inorganic pyrophosphatase-like protein/inorganic pyrophosphatase
MKATDRAIIKRLLRITDAEPRKLQKMEFQGLPVSIEVPVGEKRELRNKAGAIVYSRILPHSYGFLDGTKGLDGDEVDVIIGDHPDSKLAFIVHMEDLGPDIDQRENEDKVFLGFLNFDAVSRSFSKMYGPEFFGGCETMTMRQFRPWLRQYATTK